MTPLSDGRNDLSMHCGEAGLQPWQQQEVTHKGHQQPALQLRVAGSKGSRVPLRSDLLLRYIDPHLLPNNYPLLQVAVTMDQTTPPTPGVLTLRVGSWTTHGVCPMKPCGLAFSCIFSSLLLFPASRVSMVRNCLKFCTPRTLCLSGWLLDICPTDRLASIYAPHPHRKYHHLSSGAFWA
jgi:hypothetical protein